MSEARNQAELLADGFLNQFDDGNRVDFTGAGELPIVSRMLVIRAAAFIQRVQQNLDNAGKVSTGTLSTDIAQGEVTVGGGSVSIEVGYPASSPGAKYYDFVNEGVKGIISGQPSSSPYSFRKLSAPPVMVSAIQGWIETNNIRSREETQKRDLSPLQSKRADIQQLSRGEASRGLAYAIAKSIKRRGLPRTRFFDEAAEFAFGQDFMDAVAKAVGADIRIAIRQANRPQGG
jgi:hypothetical protein